MDPDVSQSSAVVFLFCFFFSLLDELGNTSLLKRRGGGGIKAVGTPPAGRDQSTLPNPYPSLSINIGINIAVLLGTVANHQRQISTF